MDQYCNSRDKNETDKEKVKREGQTGMRRELPSSGHLTGGDCQLLTTGSGSNWLALEELGNETRFNVCLSNCVLDIHHVTSYQVTSSTSLELECQLQFVS